MDDSTKTINMDFSSDNNSFNSLSGSMSMEFESVHEQPAKIKVIGVGGGGGNAVNHMYRQGIRGVDFIVCNTDAKALDSSPVPNKIVLGKLGAGNVPERAKKLALEHRDEIREAISDDTQMLFITAGMGGGTGTGAAPVIAEIAKSIELEDEMVPRILVVAIVTMPFSFEGKKRREQAMQGIEELKKHVDAILIINNDKLRDLHGDLPFTKAFAQADDVLLTAAKGIAEIITVSAYVNIDFRDVNTVMEKSGTALMGAGQAAGDDRASKAIKEATTSVLLDDNDIRGAKNILLYFSCSPNNQITMDELGEVTDFLTDLTKSSETNIIWGIGDDESLNDELRITLIATGFEQKPGPRRRDIDGNPIAAETPKNKEASIYSNPVATVSVASQKPVETVVESFDDGINMKHVTEVATATTVVEQKVEQSSKQPDINYDQPFQNRNGQRVFELKESEMAQLEEVEVEASVQERPAKLTGNSFLDDIRIVPKANTTTVETKVEEPVAESIIAPKNYNDKIIECQISNAFTPEAETDDMRLKHKAERIRRINEALRNNPNGPKMVEEMTTAELTSDAIFETMHSSESDAARTVITPDGRMTHGISIFKDLPD